MAFWIGLESEENTLVCGGICVFFDTFILLFIVSKRCGRWIRRGITRMNKGVFEEMKSSLRMMHVRNADVKELGEIVGKEHHEKECRNTY